jgi:rod shape-determining protein MreC
LAKCRPSQVDFFESKRHRAATNRKVQPPADMANLGSDSRPIIARGPSLLARGLFLVALSAGIMALDVRQRYLEDARGWLAVIVEPLHSAVDLPGRAWNWLTESFADRDSLRRQNAELAAQLRAANLQLLRMAALTEENIALRAIREASAGLATRSLVAEIMRVDIDPFRHRVLINHGTKDGVYKGQAVLDARGIFGQITRLGPNSAEALLITDAEHATPVRVNRTGLRSIAVGTGDFNKLSLPFITGDADLQVGDLLVTSGLGGIYPPGYPVAQISKVKREPNATFATVEAQPLAHMDRARELLLIWYQPPSADAELADQPTAGKARR